jgi:hypothetical protein
VGPWTGHTAIDELNPDLSTFGLECRVNGKWKSLQVGAAMKGSTRFDAKATAVRLTMTDLAGNEVVALSENLP